MTDFAGYVVLQLDVYKQTEILLTFTTAVPTSDSLTLTNVYKLVYAQNAPHWSSSQEARVVSLGLFIANA